MANSGHHLLTTREVAQLLRVHPKQVYRLLQRGLPALRVGDEWRFDADEVLSWAAGAPQGAGRPARETDAASRETDAAPSLLAANGDCAVEVLLAALRATGGPLLGWVQSDQRSGAELLAAGRVLIAGQHAGDDAAGESPLPKCARLHLVRREVGLAVSAGARLRGVSSLVGKRLASRPPTAGLRRRLDRELGERGIDPARAYRRATEHASHRDVVLAVLAGEADAGLTTHAWACAARLDFLSLGSEAYELAIPVRHLGDPRAVALCQAAQDGAVRRRLREEFGYDVKHTGELGLGAA